MRLSAVIVLVAVSRALADKSLIFPSETNNSYVEVIPKRLLNLHAFTLCMRVATELSGQREVILFAYRTRDTDELNVWRERDGRLSLYIGGSSDGVQFKVPGLGTLQTQLCVTWDSSSGATAFFIDGKKSLTKIYKKDRNVRSRGRIILGQDPDSNLGDFEADQSFVGEISDVNMWSTVLSDSNVRNMFLGSTVPRPDVLDWKSADMQKHGDVEIININL